MNVFSRCPCVQGKEPSVRQLALLHFRNTIVLSVKLEDALSRPRARVPPSVTQMLLILQVGLLFPRPLLYGLMVKQQMFLRCEHGDLPPVECDVATCDYVYLMA